MILKLINSGKVHPFLILLASHFKIIQSQTWNINSWDTCYRHVSQAGGNTCARCSFHSQTLCFLLSKIKKTQQSSGSAASWVRAKQIFWRGMLFERTQGQDFDLTSQNSPSGQIKPTQDGRPRAADRCFCCCCCSTTRNIKVIWDRQTATHPSPVIWQAIESIMSQQAIKQMFRGKKIKWKKVGEKITKPQSHGACWTSVTKHRHTSGEARGEDWHAHSYEH